MHELGPEPNFNESMNFDFTDPQQLVAGFFRLGNEQWPVQGFGLRDHSCGPRHWQAPWYYRWLTANFGAELGFMGSRIARRGRQGIRVSADHRLEVTGTVVGMVPLRNRRTGPDGRELVTTRICEGTTRWTTADGRVGYGLSEHLDQIVDGVPVGAGQD